MKKDQQGRKGLLQFLFKNTGGAAVESRGQVPGMVLIKRYEVLQGGSPERLHVLNSGCQSALSLPEYLREGKTETLNEKTR